MMLFILFAACFLQRINLLPLFTLCQGLGLKFVHMAAQPDVLLEPDLWVLWRNM